ncbi:MAG: hypothetical protein JXA20_16425 [Spirochaetes bacterium]|nr:hypothetical protein [Spirochaetota bacterium]
MDFWTKQRYAVAAALIAVTAVLLAAGCSSFGLSGSSEMEPNNDVSLADRVAGFEINGVIGFEGDVDWYVLNNQEGYNPTFSVFHDPSIDVDFEVYNTMGGNMSRVGSAQGTQSGDSIRVYTPGQVHLRVWSYRGTGPYRIQIMP